MKNIIIAIVLSFVLTGCATIKMDHTTEQPAHLTWQQRQAKLEQLQNWNLQGAMSIREPDRTTLAHIQWQQRQKNYDIRLSGPFNIGGVRVQGGMGHVTLAGVQRGAVVEATTPEQLVEQQLGVQLPISNMYYWVRGIPAPQTASKRQLDSQNRLAVLQQQGWVIHYQTYQTVRGIDLPGTLLLSNPDMRVKMVIKQWMLQ